MSTKPKLIPAGSNLLKLGLAQRPPSMDCRVVAEEEYQRMMSLMQKASRLLVYAAVRLPSDQTLEMEEWENNYNDFLKE
jgi:hypothetical protein